MLIPSVFWIEVVGMTILYVTNQQNHLVQRIICFLFISLSWGLTAQTECYLGLGGQDNAMIIEIFQLDSLQQVSIKNLSAELKYRNDMLKEQADTVLKHYPQRSTEDMLLLSTKYRTLMDSMQQNLRMLDKRLLESFNPKQYAFYKELCGLTGLTPFFVAPSVKEK